jgi:hypothetical protein
MGSPLSNIISRISGNGIQKGGAQNPGIDQAKALSYTQQRWDELKNAYVVWHQSIWQALLFYANQSWI